MAKAAKASQQQELYKTRSKKRRIDSNGVECPPNTFIRESKRGPVWYAKITVGGKQIELNSKILECDRRSREAIQEWASKEYHRLSDLHEANLRNEIVIADYDAEFAPFQSKTSIGSVARLEVKYQEETHPNSPNIRTVKAQLKYFCDFFGPERETTSLTILDLDSYVNKRLCDITVRKRAPSINTIYREIASFERAVNLASDYGLFLNQGVSYRFILPVNKKRRRNLKKHHRVDPKQKSQQFTYAECKEWLRAAQGTHLEHYTYIAYYTGMRSQELQQLCWNWVHVVGGSGRYAEVRLPRELYMDSDVDDQPVILTETVYRYLERLARGKKGHEPLLKKLTSLSYWIRMVANRTSAYDSHGNPLYITLRSLRASYGRLIYERTGNIFKAQIAMRHKNIKITTEHYVSATGNDMDEIAKILDAVGH